jgi:hypothetical protein
VKVDEIMSLPTIDNYFAKQKRCDLPQVDSRTSEDPHHNDKRDGMMFCCRRDGEQQSSGTVAESLVLRYLRRSGSET